MQGYHWADIVDQELHYRDSTWSLTGAMASISDSPSTGPSRGTWAGVDTEMPGCCSQPWIPRDRSIPGIGATSISPSLNWMDRPRCTSADRDAPIGTSSSAWSAVETGSVKQVVVPDELGRERR